MSNCSGIDRFEIIQFNDYEKELWKEVRQPLGVTMELTPRCNFNCVHCYLQDNHDEKEMSYKEVIRILDILYEKGVLFITFTGGEVFSRSDFIDIYVYAKKKGFFVGIFTNGYEIKYSDIEIMKKYPPLLVDISLYGGTEATYELVTNRKNSFSKVLDTCKRLKANKIRFALKSPIIKETYDELPIMKKIAETLGVDFRFSFDISPTLENNPKPKDHQVEVKKMFLAEVKDSIRRKVGENAATVDNDWITDFNAGNKTPMFLCMIATNDFFIDYKGYMCPCAAYRIKGEKLTDNFDDIWEKFSLYKKMTATNNNKCIGCESRYFCKVCPAEQDTYYGNLEEIPKCLCAFSKAKKSYFKDGISFEQCINLL